MVLGGWILLNLAGVVSGGLVPVTYHNGLHLYEVRRASSLPPRQVAAGPARDGQEAG